MSPPTWLLISLVLMYHLVDVNSYPNEDLIKALPGQPMVTFQQFSGYVTVDEAKQRNLFYYFVEAETTPETKPLVLWLNGGPGCSSVGGGGFRLHGPFTPSSNALIKNDYSWNKEANMLYLESPAGVGFSYSTNTSFYGYIDDAMTARDNLAFLENWFVKFPEYKTRDLYLSGESYAGHYVPQLAQLILNSNFKSNLKGIAIGNPLIEHDTEINSKSEYLRSHGLISDATFDLLQTVCNYSTIRRQTIRKQVSPDCARVKAQIQSEMGEFIDPYDISLGLCFQMPKQQSSPAQKVEVGKVDVCGKNKVSFYLNRKDVQEALRAQLVGIKVWTYCTLPRNGFLYNQDNTETSALPTLAEVTKAGIRVLVYSGDQDGALPFTGTRVLIANLAKELNLNTTVPYRSWLENNQVGGFTQVYGDILTFATIRGAGHEAPFSQPARSFVMFSSYLQGKPFPAPPTTPPPKTE